MNFTGGLLWVGGPILAISNLFPMILLRRLPRPDETHRVQNVHLSRVTVNAQPVDAKQIKRNNFVNSLTVEP